MVKENKESVDGKRRDIDIFVDNVMEEIDRKLKDIGSDDLFQKDEKFKSDVKDYLNFIGDIGLVYYNVKEFTDKFVKFLDRYLQNDIYNFKNKLERILLDINTILVKCDDFQFNEVVLSLILDDFNKYRKLLCYIYELEDDNLYKEYMNDDIKNFLGSLINKDYGDKKRNKRYKEENNVLNHLCLYPEKLKDFLDIYPEILKDNNSKVDRNFRRKILSVLGVSKNGKDVDVFLEKKETALFMLQRDFGKHSEETGIVKGLDNEEIINICTIYLNQKNRYNLSSKEAFFRALLIDYGETVILLNKYNFLSKSDEKRYLDKKLKEYIHELSYPDEIKKFYLNFVKNNVGKDSFWKNISDLPLYTENLRNLNVIEENGIVNVDFFDNYQNIIKCFKLKSAEKDFVKKYIEYKLIHNQGNKELILLKTRLEWLDKGVSVFLRNLFENFRDKIEGKLNDYISRDSFLDNNVKKVLIGEGDKKGIIDVVLDEMFSKVPEDIVKGAENTGSSLFDYMRTQFYKSLIEKITNKNEEIDKNIKREIIRFFAKKKDDFFKFFGKVVLDIKQVKYETQKFLEENDFIDLLEKLKNELKKDVRIENDNYESYILASLFVLGKVNSNVKKEELENQIKKFVRVKGNKEWLDSNILMKVIEKIRFNDDLKKYLEDLRQYYQQNLNEIKEMRKKAIEEFDSYIYEKLKQYDTDLAEYFWDNHLDSFVAEERLEQQSGISKENFENEINTYVKVTNGEKPVWTYPEYKDGNYVIKLHFPKLEKNNFIQNKEGIIIQATSIIELNVKLLKKWVECQGLKWINLEISAPDIFKDKFGKDLNKLFVPSDIEDISKIMTRYLLEKIDYNKDVKNYINTYHRNLYKKLIFRPLEGINEFIRLMNLNNTFKKRVENIFPKEFILENRLDIEKIPDGLFININKFFEKRKDEESLGVLFGLGKKILNKFSLR